MDKVGRPSKFKPEYIEQAKNYASLGATDEQMAVFFGVDRSTFYEWKVKQPKFRDALIVSKVMYDTQIERSLAERARGYTCMEDKIFCKDGEVTIVPTVKQYPPDTTACIFWLKNRQPDEWRDVQHHDNTNRFEDEEGDDLDLARKLVYLLEKGANQITH
jgi:hypothetical protein